ncbi:MAG: hypothetical protein IT513_04745, partial [Burkholderiales bacterium]|nr:hypothetical protein [Burkholderiales bacterium]
MFHCRRQLRALGIEYNPDMAALSRRNAERAGTAWSSCRFPDRLVQAGLTYSSFWVNIRAMDLDDTFVALADG